ncbi:MAG: DUF1353 domain-containing protein [Acidobacteriales bacterium]|nr:DUF1353 domain-containing protein [Terriglobales bacterium]
MKATYWQTPDMPTFRVVGWDGEDMLIKLAHYLPIPTSRGVITVPTGFVSDGLSIPALVRPLVGPATGRPFVAGLLHDWLYSKASTANFNMTRKNADDLFLEVMSNLGIGFRRNLIYAAVRAFGWRFYKRK